MSSKPLSVIWFLWMLTRRFMHSLWSLHPGRAVWWMTTLWAEPFMVSFFLGAAAPHCCLETMLPEKQFWRYIKKKTVIMNQTANAIKRHVQRSNDFQVQEMWCSSSYLFAPYLWTHMPLRTVQLPYVGARLRRRGHGNSNFPVRPCSRISAQVRPRNYLLLPNRCLSHTMHGKFWKEIPSFCFKQSFCVCTFWLGQETRSGIIHVLLTGLNRHH